MLNLHIQALIFFTPPVIVLIFCLKALYAYMHLYREKKNLDYPVLLQEIATYSGPIYKIFLNPLIMFEVIFVKHKDKELAAAVKKVRILYLAYMGVSFLMLLILFIYIFYL